MISNRYCLNVYICKAQITNHHGSKCIIYHLSDRQAYHKFNNYQVQELTAWSWFFALKIFLICKISRSIYDQLQYKQTRCGFKQRNLLGQHLLTTHTTGTWMRWESASVCDLRVSRWNQANMRSRDILRVIEVHIAFIDGVECVFVFVVHHDSSCRWQCWCCRCGSLWRVGLCAWWRKRRRGLKQVRLSSHVTIKHSTTPVKETHRGHRAECWLIDVIMQHQTLQEIGMSHIPHLLWLNKNKAKQPQP